MDWLHKLRKALLAFSARLQLRKSKEKCRVIFFWDNFSKQCRTHVAAAAGDQCNGVYGLLKLQDDVQMCGYQDVQIMWNMLSKAEQEQIQTMATTDQSPMESNSKQGRRRRNSCSFRTFFGSGTQLRLG